MQKVLKGVGGGLIAGKVAQRVAPQYTTIAALGGGYLAGGGMGAIASFLVNTGVLDNLLSGGGLGGLLGGGAASPAQQAVRSL